MMKKQTNQSGAAAIMFAMFMVIIISLLSIGFATLVRRDQRATLDKTLSNQAQYAAESAINKVQADIASGAITSSSTGCNTPGDPRPNLVLSGVTISCLQWTLEIDSITFSPLSTIPATTQVQPPSGGGGAVNSLKISWTATNAAATKYAGTPTSLNSFSLPGSPTEKIPVVKLVLASSDLSQTSTVYLIPTDGAMALADASSSGSFGYADCVTFAPKCVAGVTNLPGGPWNSAGRGLVALESIGDTSSVTLEAYSTNSPAFPIGSRQKLIGAGAAIDVTARSQDVIKRLRATVSLKPTSWHPGFSATADSLCKSYQVDGTNNNVVGPVGSLCPN